MRQLIIARKDLNMSGGKLAAQVAHASMAYFTRWIADKADLDGHIDAWLPEDILKEWVQGVFTKTVCEAKNQNQLLKAKTMAEELGLQEGKDFFLIYDACLTELTPEIIDENGVGRTLTCIGFRPLDDKTAWKISKKYQLYK